MDNQPPRMANRIELDIRAQTLTLDGEPFPWAVKSNSIEVLTDDADMCGVRLTILADKSVLVNDITSDA